MGISKTADTTVVCSTCKFSSVHNDQIHNDHSVPYFICLIGSYFFGEPELQNS